MSCKTLVTTRTYAVNNALGVWDTDIDPVPRYIKAWADPLYAYTGGIECDADPFTEPVPTLLSEIIPKLKTSQYGVFQNSLFSNSNKFKYKFQVFLKENDILSETITGTSSILNNIPDDFVGYYDFQPIITSTNTTGLTIYRDVVDVVYNPNAANRPKEFSSIGISFDGSSLRVIMLSGNYGDKNVTPTACDYAFQSIVSDPITIAGIVNIELICVNKIYTIKVNDVIIPNTVTGNPVFYNNKTVLGKFTDSIIETRYLYSDLCSIYYEVNEVPTYQTLFENAISSGLTITIPNTIGSNNLVLHNYSLGSIVDNSNCCPIYQSVTASNSQIGCCFTPTEEDNIRYKINNWYLNSLGFSSIEYAEMMLKIGKNKEANEKLEKINSVHQFVFYIMSIRNRMVCEGKPYTDFVSDETLNTFVEYFNCRGINIKCPLQIAMIGNFTNCCDQIEASVDCECTDEIPSAIISAPIYQYDLASEADQTLEYTQLVEYPGPPSIVPFSCCSGNQSMVVSSTLINPHNLPISIIPGALTTDGTFTYDITYNYLNSVITDVKEFYVQFTVCGQTILRKHLYSAIDTCVTIPSTVVVENELANIILDINEDFAFNVETVGVTINLGDFECCHSGQVSKVLSIDTTRITPESGLTILSPIVGQEGQGSILLSYHFNGEQALVGTIQRVYLSYSICDEIVYSGYIVFEVQNNCTPDIVPTFTPNPTLLAFDFNGLGGNTTSFQIGITNYQCCQQPTNITYWFPDNGFQIFTQMELFGLKFNLPLGNQQASNNVTLTYTFDRAKYLQFITAGNTLPGGTYNFKMNYTICDNATINSYDINITFTDTCSPVPGPQSTTSVTLDLYQSLGKSIFVNTEITYGCSACDSTSNQFSYLGIDSGANNAVLSDTIIVPTSNLATGYNLQLRSRPHLIDIGDFNNVSYPIDQTTDLLIDSNCGANSLTVNTFLLDNYMRSDGNTQRSVLAKTSLIGFNPNNNNNIMFIIHLTGSSSIELSQFNMSNLISTGSARVRADVYTLGTSTINYSGTYTQNINDVATITDISTPSTAIHSFVSPIVLTGAVNTAPTPNIFSPILPDGFYAVVISFEYCTIDYLEGQFNII